MYTTVKGEMLHCNGSGLQSADGALRTPGMPGQLAADPCQADAKCNSFACRTRRPQVAWVLRALTASAYSWELHALANRTQCLHHQSIQVGILIVLISPHTAAEGKERCRAGRSGAGSGACLLPRHPHEWQPALGVQPRRASRRHKQLRQRGSARHRTNSPAAGSVTCAQPASRAPPV